MKTYNRTLALVFALLTGAAHAAGPLRTTETNPPVPYRWDMSRGPIPVYTDGGGAYTYDHDGVTPFITIERANEITQFAFDQWNNVPTATFEANIAGTIEDQTGIADVTAANAAQLYGVENGYGFWVLYDTDGSLLENYFGVPKTAVLGIAFPEFSDGGSTITEATAVMNGWNVYDTDIGGERVAGVFTHEFGHAINLSHSQVNGHIGYFSAEQTPLFPGIAGCGVEPVYGVDYPASFPGRLDPEELETMYPMIDHRTDSGKAMSTVNTADDIAAISNLYPTADYLATTGTISGVLRLKDGKTEFSGVNIVARNVKDLTGDAISAMSGDQTQGKVGPDGRFTIHGLKPGQQYVVYIEEILAGGFPTTPQMLYSVGEYWNAAESADPIADNPCQATPILAQAGVVKNADITFNGYVKGIDFTPIVGAHLTDLSKNGMVAGGIFGTTAFIWRQNQGFEVLPPEFKATNSSINRVGNKMLVNVDLDGNGISSAAIWNSNTGTVTNLGDFNGDTCGGESFIGKSSSYGNALDDAGTTAVGLAYIDVDNDGFCQTYRKHEVVPFVWTAQQGMRQLDTTGAPFPNSWTRAQFISGNGKLILGSNGGGAAVAWINEGPMIDLFTLAGAVNAYGTNQTGTLASLQTANGIVLWDTTRTGPEAFQSIGGLRWCHDVPMVEFGTDYCALLGEEELTNILGPIPMVPIDMSDDGRILVARGGSVWTGFHGGFWSETTGWMTWKSFFKKQGVIEATDINFNNPVAISDSGRVMVGGVRGFDYAWHVNMDQVFVCQKGNSVKVDFPNGLFQKLEQGAQFGRCEHLD